MSSTEIVSIVIFFLYIFLCIIGFTIIFLMGRAYLDLSRGLHRILERHKENNSLNHLEELADEIEQHYLHYIKWNPSATKKYDGIVNWLDDVLLQTNLLHGNRHKFGVWFDEYYDLLQQLHHYFENQQPFYQCSDQQQRILILMQSLQTDQNADLVKQVTTLTKDEFIHQINENKKNNAINYISLGIGIAGILVSVLLTVLQLAA
ncbi:MAG: hypothetical protein ACI4R7_00405 [Oliverpabstia sp.]